MAKKTIIKRENNIEAARKYRERQQLQKQLLYEENIRLKEENQHYRDKFLELYNKMVELETKVKNIIS